MDVSPKFLLKIENLPKMIHEYGYRLTPEDEAVLYSFLLKSDKNNNVELPYATVMFHKFYDNLNCIFEEAVHHHIMDMTEHSNHNA